MPSVDFETMTVIDDDETVYPISTLMICGKEVNPSEVENWRLLEETDRPIGIVFKHPDGWKMAHLNLPLVN